MAKTSSAVKDRWNAKNYDELKIRVPKGHKAVIQAAADNKAQSVNSYVVQAIDERITRDKTKETGD